MDRKASDHGIPAAFHVFRIYGVYVIALTNPRTNCIEIVNKL